jgi:hypothetical protein
MMDKNGRFTVSTYNRVFGSWNEALREAGCDLNNRNNIPEAELLDEIKRLQSELGRTPTAIDMESKGEFGWATYETAFGSWNAAVQEAGFEPNGRINIEKSELIDAIKSLRTRLGQTPGRRDMDRNGQFDSGTYLSTFGSWNNALREADIEPNKRHDVSDTELIEAIEQLRDTLGRVPTRVEMDNQGAFSGTTYRHRFGSWSDALVTAGLNPNGKLRPDHLDHIVRSTWEADVADLLLDAGVGYEYESLEISYGGGRTYTPDFVTNQYVIEVKGHLYEPEKVVKKARAAITELDDRQYVVVGTAVPADIHIPWENRGQITELFG